jgi:hypothetical protein
MIRVKPRKDIVTVDVGGHFVKDVVMAHWWECGSTLREKSKIIWEMRWLVVSEVVFHCWKWGGNDHRGLLHNLRIYALSSSVAIFFFFYYENKVLSLLPADFSSVLSA